MNAETQGMQATPARRPPGMALSVQLLICGILLAAWQWLPKMHILASRLHFLAPFYISAPSRIGPRLFHLAFGGAGVTPIWGALGSTLEATLFGVAIGLAGGVLAGLLLGNNANLAAVCHPLVVISNAVPRIVLIPIIIMVFGIGTKSVIIVTAISVFFIIFFNAYEGARQVGEEMLQNAHILGAPRSALMFRVRMPYTFAWTFAALPAATSFGLVAAVIAEMLGGAPGMGQDITNGLNTADATQTLSIAIILALVGIAFVVAGTAVRHRYMKWWENPL